MNAMDIKSEDVTFLPDHEEVLKFIFFIIIKQRKKIAENPFLKLEA